MSELNSEGIVERLLELAAHNGEVLELTDCEDIDAARAHIESQKKEIEAIREKTIEECAAALKTSLADFEVRGPYENGYITAKRSAVQALRSLSESVRKAKETQEHI